MRFTFSALLASSALWAVAGAAALRGVQANADSEAREMRDAETRADLVMVELPERADATLAVGARWESGNELGLGTTRWGFPCSAGSMIAGTAWSESVLEMANFDADSGA
jgi:hypothetical protein